MRWNQNSWIYKIARFKCATGQRAKKSPTWLTRESLTFHWTSLFIIITKLITFIPWYIVWKGFHKISSVLQATFIIIHWGKYFISDRSFCGNWYNCYKFSCLVGNILIKLWAQAGPYLNVRKLTIIFINCCHEKWSVNFHRKFGTPRRELTDEGGRCNASYS